MRAAVLPIIFAVAITMAFSYQDAYATTLLYSDPFQSMGSTLIIVGPNAIGADDFILISANSVTDIHFYMRDNSGVFDVNDVPYFIYQNAGGQPGAEIDSGLLVNVGTSPEPAICGTCFRVWGDLPAPLPLAAGTYWFGIEVTSDWGLLGEDTPVNDNLVISFDDGINWISFGTLGIPFDITGPPVGGIGIPIDTTALFLATAQSTSLWMLPVLAGIGIGVFVIKKKF